MKNKPIFIAELSNAEYGTDKKIYDQIRTWGMEVVVPFNFKKKVVGLLLLSEKESKDVYNNTDVSVLELAGVHAAMAIKNAQLYYQTLDFNKRLSHEVEKATRDLRRANEELKRLDQAKSEFVSIASHQLRTPLTVVKGYVSMMLEGSFGFIPEKQKDPLNKVYESNERLISLVEDLLNISRIESGKQILTFEDVQLDDVVESVFLEMKLSQKKPKVRFEYIKPEEKLPTIKADREKIRQTVMNLLDNSIKYTDKGYIKISLSQLPDRLQFCVEDSGIGISKRDMPKLFTKFSRGQDISLLNTEGTGLGLYVVKQTIEAHGGRVWVESDGINKGSTFCFVLPIIK